MRLGGNAMPDYLMPGGPVAAGAQYDWRQDRRLAFGSVGAAILLVGAFGTGLQYGYFTFVRIYVCLVALSMAYSEEKSRRPVGALLAVVAAITFNPVVPLHLERETWHLIDLATAAWLSWLALEGLSSVKGRSFMKAQPALFIAVAGLAPNVSFNSASRSENTLIVDTNMTTETVTMNDAAATEEVGWWTNAQNAGSASPRATEAPAAEYTDLPATSPGPTEGKTLTEGQDAGSEGEVE